MKKVKQYDFVDKYNKLYVRIKVGKTGWDRFISIDKKIWKKTHKDLSMKDALSIRENIINNNYKNLYDIITNK